MTDYIASQFEETARNFLALKSLSAVISSAADLWIATLKAGGKIVFCGNGGSAADAQHLAAELTGRYLMNRPAMAGLALTTDTSALTAIGNDFGYDVVFSRQLEALGKKGDVLYAISTSGNSPNVLKAIESAKAMGIKVIGITGEGGGKMADVCDIMIPVPAKQSNHIQEMHIAVGHLLCELAEKALYAQSAVP